MNLEELSMGNLVGFCNDALTGSDSNTVPTLGEDTSSSPLIGPPSGYYANVLNNQEEIEGSIMELTSLISGMRATQQSMMRVTRFAFSYTDRGHSTYSGPCSL